MDKRPPFYMVARGAYKNDRIANLSDGAFRALFGPLWDEGKDVGGVFANENQLELCLGKYYKHVDELREAGLLDGLEIHKWSVYQVDSETAYKNRMSILGSRSAVVRKETTGTAIPVNAPNYPVRPNGGPNAFGKNTPNGAEYKTPNGAPNGAELLETRDRDTGDRIRDTGDKILDTPTPSTGAGEEMIPAPLDNRPDVDEACHVLAEKMALNGVKLPSSGTGWRKEARLLLDKDERPLEQVLDVIRWSQADPFWQANIHSMTKVRQKYDQLRLKMNRDQPNYGKPSRSEELIARARREFDEAAQEEITHAEA